MTVTLEWIVSMTAREFGTTQECILGKDRQLTISFARHAAMWFARKYTAHSFPEIGEFFRRDHTSVMSACEKIDQILKEPASNVSRMHAIQRDRLHRMQRYIPEGIRSIVRKHENTG